MKNLVKFGLTIGILAFALVLASCQSLLEPLPSETTAEVSTAKPEVTVEPGETVDPGETAEPDETAAPADTDEPGETASPTETAEPETTEPELNIPKQPLSNLVSGGTVIKPHSPDEPIYSSTMGDYRNHLGIDVAVSPDSEVFALYDGTMENIWEDAMMGHCLAINHGNGLMSFYKNLSGSYPAEVKEGATVTAGQAVGYVGDSAMIEIAEEPHLHFEMTLNGEQVDPADYLEGAQMPQPEEPETDEPIPDDPAIRFDKQPLSALVSNGSICKYHDPALQVFNQTTNDYRVHLGIDIATAEGADVLATAHGTVKSIYTDPFMGVCLELDHGNGVTSIYKNLSETMADGIAEGVTVTVGQKLGTVGGTAISEAADAAHLHFEMEYNGESADPLTYISEASYEASLSKDTAYES